MKVEEIKKILPHREPFLFVDEVIKIQDKRIEAVKKITGKEYFFPGHFPGNPLMPGVLQVEAMAQTGGILVLNQLPEARGKLTLFLAIDKLKFRRQVLPGDTLKIICELLSLKKNICKVFGKVYVDDKIACEGELLLGFFNK
jgi:UDP-3-O-[3-hydroxymyristoyl] N-acetylglucosamine deacetylase/3-hydroxyacyl-[acyl-carrier-protein] dehydratase